VASATYYPDTAVLVTRFVTEEAHPPVTAIATMPEEAQA
jgi:hypothetical protein